MAPEQIVGLNQIGTFSPESEHEGACAGRRRAWVLPTQASSRLLVLLGGLLVVKLALLFSLAKHLQEIHWRTSGEPLTWVSPVAFYALAAVLVYTLVELGRQCQTGGARTVRVINALVLGFGGLLIFLTFHEGDKNYVYPVMTGILKWTDLWSYLSLNFFFRPPYLAVWIFAYVAGYYFLVRTGRERMVLWQTAGFAGSYWLLCSREFLERPSDLWVVLLFGLLAVALLGCRGKRFHPAWQFAVLAWTLLMWGLFCLGSAGIAHLPPYFAVLAGWLVVLFGVASWLAKRAGALAPWSKVVGFYFVALLLLASANYPAASNFNNLLQFSAKFPHYFLGELLVVAAVALVAVGYARLRPGGSWWWLDILGLGLIGLALVDLRLAQIMGVRLGWDVLAFGADPKMMLRVAKPHLATMLVGLVVAVGLYVIAVRAVGRGLIRLRNTGKSEDWVSQGWSLGGCFAALALLGLVVTKPDNAEGQGLLRLVESSPLWKNALTRTQSPEEFMRNARELGMPDWRAADAVQPLKPRRDLNVVLIFQESTYNQHLSLFSGEQETQPRLSRYKDRMELFPNFFSSFAGSIHARFATFTGLYPVTDFNRFTLERVPVKSLFEVLSENGYECSMFYSSFYDYTGFRSFLKDRQLAKMFDADTMPGAVGAERVAWGLEEATTVKAIREQIAEYATNGQRFFLTYIPAAPHQPFDHIPREFRQYKADEVGNYLPLYLNELLYMDANIAAILDELKAGGLLDKTLVVITADHGEMLGENGGPIGHGWKITPQLANVPLIVMDPDHPGYRINDRIGSQVDLLPTLLDTLGLPLPRGELYQGQSLYAQATKGGRVIYLDSYEDFAVITDGEMRIGNRKDPGGMETTQPAPVYQIKNVGATTAFVETNRSARPFSLRQFDDFQLGLLRNYDFYRGALGLRNTDQALNRAR